MRRRRVMITRMELPQAGRPIDDVIADLVAKRATATPAGRTGARSGWCTTADASVHEVAERAAAVYLHENALNTHAFPSLASIQNEVVGWTGELLHAPPTAAGFLTSGGTESIQCAVLAARERGRAERGIAVGQDRRRRIGARRVPQVGAPVRHADRDRAGHRRLDRRRRRDGGRRRRPDGARGRVGAAVPAGRRRPDPGRSPSWRQRRRVVSRRRLHGRVRAAVRRDARPRRAAVGLPRRRRALDLGRHPQARLRAQGRVGDRAPHARSCAATRRGRSTDGWAASTARPTCRAHGRGCRWRRRGR